LYLRAIFERNEIQSLIQLNNLHVCKFLNFIEKMFFKLTFKFLILGLLFSAESCCMFLIYLCIPFVLEFSSAAFLNVNLLTADFYTVLIGIFFKKYKVNKFSFCAFCLCYLLIQNKQLYLASWIVFFGLHLYISRNCAV